MTVLYKYYSPHTARLVLENKQVRFSPLAEFNDPFECFVFPTTEFSSEEFAYEVYLQILDVFNSEETIELNDKSSPMSRLMAAYQCGDLEVELDPHDFAVGLAHMLTNKEIVRGPTEWEKAAHKRLAEYIGAFCLTETFSNLLMWAHYAQNHEGVVIGFDINYFPKLPFPFRPVIYSNDYPKGDVSSYAASYIGRKMYGSRGEGWISNRFFTKSKEWEYEKEWRILSSSEISENNHLVELPGEAFHSIYVGCRSDAEDEEFFIQQACNINETIRIYKASVSTSSYCLEFQDLETR